MESINITAGFSDILAEYSDRFRIPRTRAIKPQFSFDVYELMVHESSKVKNKMVLAIYNPLRDVWDIKFKKSCYGYDLIEFAIKETKDGGKPYYKVHLTMEDLYKLHGLFPAV